MQREVPDAIRGRVFAVDYGLVTLTMSLSSLLAGLLSDRIGPVKGVAITATLCVVLGPNHALQRTKSFF